MKNLKGLILAFIILCTALGSCKKYEDGPAFTLLTKRARMIGTWKIGQVFYDGRDITALVIKSFGEDYVWDLKNDGTYVETGTIDDTGTWRFISDKERISFSSTDPNIGTYSYKILRLKNKELWISEVDAAGGLFEIHLKQ